MRRIAYGVLLVLAAATTSLGQQDEAQVRNACFARVIGAMVDYDVLSRLIALKLTDAQLQALAAVYQQFPVAAPPLAIMEDVARQAEAIRAKLLTEPAGEAVTQAEMMVLQKAIAAALGQPLNDPQPGEEFSVVLRPQELAVWGVLTPAQRGQVLNCGDARATAHRALDLLGRLRDSDDTTWAKTRDALADALAAGAGAVGTAARDNARVLLLEFLNRLRRMPEGDFARQREELSTNLALLLAPGADLAGALADCAPGLVRNGLAQSLLRWQTPGLLQTMQANRAQRANAPAKPND